MRSFAKLARDPREFLTNELGFDQSELFITNQIRSEPMKHDFFFLRFAIYQHYHTTTNTTTTLTQEMILANQIRF